MTELLAREREFLEMNEKLNRMAESKPPVETINTPKNVTRLTKNDVIKPPIRAAHNGTYTKSKGPTTFLRKQGAGDFASDASPKKQTETPKGNITNRTAAAVNNNKPSKSPPIRKNVRSSPRGGFTEAATAATAIPNRKNNSNTRTFVMRYQNPNFVASPSLELIVRDELSSLEHERQIDDESLNTASSTTASAAGAAATTTASTNKEFIEQNGNRLKSQALNMNREYRIGAEKKRFSTDGLIKFLKSKITILEGEHGTLNREMSKQKELLEKAIERGRILEQQRDQAYAKNNSLSEHLHKTEAQLEEAHTRIKERAQTQLQQHKELDELRRELKLVIQNNSNLEKRLFRTQEDLESSKTTITNLKAMERDFKENARIESENKDKQLRNLKKLRADLFNAYKKQLFLIDNLSRQNVCLEQSTLLGVTEKEFNKVLEWDGASDAK